MEHEQPNNETQPEVVVRLNPNDLVPTEEQIAQRRNQMAPYTRDRAAYCLGAVMVSVEGATQAAEQANGQWLGYHLQAGRAAIAAYEQLAEVERAARQATEP